MNKIERGMNFEKDISRKILTSGVPLLISPTILRRLGGGQIDLCYFENKNRIIVLELKKNGPFLASLQKNRLIKSAKIISQIFDCQVSGKLVTNIDNLEKEFLLF